MADGSSPGSDLTVDPDNPLAGNPRKDPETFVKAAKELSDRCHQYGTKILAQATMGVGRNYPYFYGLSELPVHETRFRFQALSVSFFILSGVSRGV